MLSIAPSAKMVALMQASVALPVMLLSLVSGALADNRDPRAVMLGTHYFMLTVSIALNSLRFNIARSVAPRSAERSSLRRGRPRNSW